MAFGKYPNVLDQQCSVCHPISYNPIHRI